MARTGILFESLLDDDLQTLIESFAGDERERAASLAADAGQAEDYGLSTSAPAPLADAPEFASAHTALRFRTETKDPFAKLFSARFDGLGNREEAPHFDSSYDPSFPAPPGFAGFVTGGTRWTDNGGSASGGVTSFLPGSGGVVAWSVAGAGLSDQTFSGFFSGSTVDLGSFMPFDYVNVLRQAFDAWASVANIEFIQIVDQGGNIGVGAMPTIRIVGGFIDGQSGSNTLAQAFFPSFSAAGGDAVFDSGNTTFYASASNFYLVAVHEIGHALGLDHEQFNLAIMNPFINTSLYGTGPLGNSLQQDDIDGIRAVYGTQDFGANSYFMPAGQTNIDLLDAAPSLNVFGNGSGNTIDGTSAAESLYGGGGNDVLIGQSGNDYLDGGSETDTANYGFSTDAWSINLATGLATNLTAGGTNTLVSIENLTGGSNNDTFTLTANSTDNVITGLGGSDEVVLTYLFGQGYSVSGSVANLVLSGSAGIDSFIGVETFRFSDGTVKTAAEVLGSPSSPEIQVTFGATDIVDGDATPSGSEGTDFGTVSSGDIVDRIFTVTNTGSGTLNLSSLAVTGGFTIVEGLAASLAPAQSDSFTIRLNSAGSGVQNGEVSFSTNDADENPFSFAVTGTVDSAGGGDAGDTFAAATTVTLPTTILQSVGFGADVDDYFRFVSPSSGPLTATLSGLATDCDLYLYDSSQAFLDSSVLGGTSTDEITFDLVGGQTYFIRVTPFSGPSDYQLALGFTSVPTFTTGPDTVTFTTAAVNAHALAGNDNITGSTFNDSIFGDSGNDTLNGGAGNDRLVGGANNDRVSGAAGSDTLRGNDGNDNINGGARSDNLSGGTGSDTFLFTTSLGPSNIDTITDFELKDTIKLDNAVMSALTTTGNLPGSQFYIGSAAHDASDRIIYDPASGALLYDADGNLGGAAIQLAILSPGLALTRVDFIVI